MLQSFSPDYKRLMLDVEATVKSKGYTEILPIDVFLEVARIRDGEIGDLMASYGINESIILEVFSQRPFVTMFEDRTGDYIGLGKDLKEIIVSSMKVAASYEKKKADISDFLLALMRTSREEWLHKFLDYIGVNPKDIEEQLTTMHREAKEDTSANGGFGGAVSGMMGEEMREGGFEPIDTTPFAHNKKPEKDKSESQTPALDFFGADLTEEARKGKIDRIIGRDTQIERLISVLNRKTKNNPCLVGDPGVGKTAVIEGLALRVAEGKVPFAMRNKRIMMLDLGGMVAGTKYRGEFESRIKQIIDEASKLENEVILFIDEIHTIIGAGAGEGTLDAANILKPAMGRGKICVIGATTVNEYQKYIEKDSALERRFQKIEVDEPTPAVANEILSGLRESFETFHNLIIDDDAIQESVTLSTRYITDRYLPDKAIDLIDEACSAKSMTYNYDEDETRALREEIEKLQKSIDDFVMSQQYHKAIKAKEEQNELEKKIRERRAKKTIPREKRLHIGAEDIQHIVEQITGIPCKNLRIRDDEKLRSLETNLKKRIIGQDAAIASIVSSIRRSATGISTAGRPVGSFLFFGPTGVGKTELVKVLAEEYYGNANALIRIDMSEFSERSSASKLIGTTAGYVGYEEGGMLTEKVRRKPYSVVLFDEIEKGNPEVFNLLLQILDDGMVTDGKGRKVNFRNTIVIMTSNIGSEEFTEKAGAIGFHMDGEKEERILADYDKIKERIEGSLDEHFAPEFINRIDKLVFFRPLDREILRRIVVLQMDELAVRLGHVGIQTTYDDRAVDHILKETYNPQYGARPVRRYIQDHIEDTVASLIIDREIMDVLALSAKAKDGELTFNKKVAKKD